MAISIFDDKAKPPTEADLRAALGKTFLLWKRLKESLIAEYPTAFDEWGYTSKSTGWGMRIKTEKRTILYMTPCKGHFLASFALGEKAVAAAQEVKLPQELLDTINTAKRYVEGRAVRIEIHSAKDIRSIEKLAAVKMSN